MKKKSILFAALICLFLLFPVSDLLGQSDEELAKPFLGKWEGSWVFSRGFRPCRVSVYIESGQAYVDYYVSPSGRYSAFERKKIKPTFGQVNSLSKMSFTLGNSEFKWEVTNGRLCGTYKFSNDEATCALTRTK